MARILLLGGTLEARQLAVRLAADGHAVTLSLAGRTRAPVPQGVPTRIGGFGGAEGLAAHLELEGVTLLIDATHPYAAAISQNAAAAAESAGVPLVALRRPAWKQQPGDRWTEVDDGPAAAAALGPVPRSVFLTLGRKDLLPFEAAPQHRYLVRSVDPVEPRPALPEAAYLLDRGPFDEAAERALLVGHGIEAIVAKNSGGPASYGKIAAARALGIEVVLIRRPALPEVPAGASVAEVVAMVAHGVPPRQKRGE